MKQNYLLILSFFTNSIVMEERLDEFKHLNSIQNCYFKIGGLSFNKPKLSENHTQINIKNQKGNVLYQQICESNAENPILQDIGKPVTISMAKTKKCPIPIKHIEVDNIHEELSQEIGSETGVMDMWIKQSKSDTIIIPNELKCVTPIIEEMYRFESFVNKDVNEWNMWLLIDIRSTRKNHTQRNDGWHYDGLKIGGYHKGARITSIYAWSNKLSSRFFTGDIEFPKDFHPDCNVNFIAQKQVKRDEDFFDTELNTVYRFDGATVHTGLRAGTNISDRVFIRVCFTPPDVLFNRLGNTINPCITYPYGDVYKILQLHLEILLILIQQ